MKSWLPCLLLFLFSHVTGNAQDREVRKEEATQKTIQDLQQAHEKQLLERQRLLSQKQRLDDLLAELKKNDLALAEKEEAILARLAEAAAQMKPVEEEAPVTLPVELVNHYQSRDPQIAAKDFVTLYGEDPKVAVALIREMKKKKSAQLMDEVVKLGENGKDIAAAITAAIGSGTP
jgi:alanyl-tRNA synthetase